MRTALKYPVALLLIALVAASPLAADVFTVKLANGKSFKSRYQPIESPRAEGKIQFLTDTGNWIALSKDNVISVESDTESRGFGKVIDTQTIALGWDPTGATTETATEEGQDPTAQLLNYLIQQDQQSSAREPYSTQQFVDPSEAGGIPMWMTNTTTPPMGGGGN